MIRTKSGGKLLGAFVFNCVNRGGGGAAFEYFVVITDEVNEMLFVWVKIFGFSYKFL